MGEWIGPVVASGLLVSSLLRLFCLLVLFIVWGRCYFSVAQPHRPCFPAVVRAGLHGSCGCPVVVQAPQDAGSALRAHRSPSPQPHSCHGPVLADTHTEHSLSNIIAFGDHPWGLPRSCWEGKGQAGSRHGHGATVWHWRPLFLSDVWLTCCHASETWGSVVGSHRCHSLVFLTCIRVLSGVICAKAASWDNGI